MGIIEKIPKIREEDSIKCIRMNKEEAQSILEKQIEGYRGLNYKELIMLIGNLETFQVLGDTGTQYQLEIQAFWDDQPNGNIRVLGSINDGGIRAFVPLSVDFIVAPDGTFIGE